MAESIDAVFYGRTFVALALLVVVVQLVVIVRVGKSKRAGVLTLAAAGAVLLLPAFGAFSTYAARKAFESAFSDGEPGEKARLISEGLAGQINAIPFTVLVTIIAGLLWAVGFGRVTRARARQGHRSSISWIALLALGLWPLAMGIFRWTVPIIRTFAGLGQLSPDEKVLTALATFAVARTELAAFARASHWGLVGLAVLALILIFMDRRAEAVRNVPGAPTAGRPLVLASVGLLAAALVGWLAARPMQAENELPWPPPTLGDPLLITRPVTPDLSGPDLLERSPVVQVFADRLGLDGREETPETLEGKLLTLRDHFALLQPSAVWNRLAIVVADRALSMERLTAVLRILHRCGYERALLAFIVPEQHDRPTFGTLSRTRSSAARVTLADEVDLELATESESGEAVVLLASEFPRYEALARRAVEERRRGRTVVLRIDR